MRITAFVLIALFASSMIDFPIATSQAHHCCCSSASVCRCKHVNGMCPLEKSVPTAIPSETGFHTPRVMERKLAQPSESKLPILKVFGCGSREEHEAAPTYSKDFYLKDSQDLTFKTPAFYFRPALKEFSFLPDLRLDRPPRLS